MPASPLDALTDLGFDVQFLSHAEAIFNVDFPAALEELTEVLSVLSIPVAALVGSGGGETTMTQGIRRALAAKGWNKHKFEIQKLVDGRQRQSVSHEVDHVRIFNNGVVAMEIEWNNKDPFYDRDLENFKRLHAEGAISAGVIITRGHSLHVGMRETILRFAHDHSVMCYEDLHKFGIRPTDRQRESVERRMRHSGGTFAEAWSEVFVSDKFGQATTHWSKLEDRVHRGVGNPCPLLLIGIPQAAIVH
ncbi:BglII/BstYI family type II restriction endonuclease [Azospirillum argentinense]